MKEPIHLDDEAAVPELRVPIGHQRIDVPILGVDDEQCRMGRRLNGCQRAPSSTASRTRASSGRRPRHGPNTPPAVNVVTGNIIPYYRTRQKSDGRFCWGSGDLSPRPILTCGDLVRDKSKSGRRKSGTTLPITQFPLVRQGDARQVPESGSRLSGHKAPAIDMSDSGPLTVLCS